MRRGATEGCLLAALSGRATGTTAAATSAAAPGLSTRRYAAASACTRHATHARLATVRRVRMLLEHTRHFVSQYNIDLLLSSVSYTFPYHTVFLSLFCFFFIFTCLFHIFFFFIIITLGCYNRRNSSSFTGPSFSPTTRYPVFTNGASDSTTDQWDAERSAPVLPTLPITLVASMPPIPANSDDTYTRQTLGSMTLPNNTEVHVIKTIACLKLAHAILLESRKNIVPVKSCRSFAGWKLQLIKVLPTSLSTRHVNEIRQSTCFYVPIEIDVSPDNEDRRGLRSLKQQRHTREATRASLTFQHVRTYNRAFERSRRTTRVFICDTVSFARFYSLPFPVLLETANE